MKCRECSSALESRPIAWMRSEAKPGLWACVNPNCGSKFYVWEEITPLPHAPNGSISVDRIIVEQQDYERFRATCDPSHENPIAKFAEQARVATEQVEVLPLVIPPAGSKPN